MQNLDKYQVLFISLAFLFQLVLITHFVVRKWRFDLVLHYGWIVYALSLPYAILSLFMLTASKQWAFWLGGFLYLIWAAYGFTVEYVKHIEWRNSFRWSVLVPYIFLYLATVMFFWWPLALIYKPLWYAYAVLFVISTFLNVTSHKPSSRFHLGEELGRSASK